MAYTLDNKCAKNCCKWTIYGQFYNSTYHQKCSHVFFETQCICPQVTNLVLVCPKKHQLSSPRKVLRRKLLHHTTFQPTEECFTCLSDSKNGSKICSNTAHKSANLYFFHHTNTVRAS